MNLLDRILGPTSGLYSILRWFRLNPFIAAMIVLVVLFAVVFIIAKERRDREREEEITRFLNDDARRKRYSY